MAKNQRSAGTATVRNSRSSQPENGRLAGSRETQQSRITRAELEKKIGERAYILWEKRGRAHGFDRQDWIAAEAQIKREFRIS